MPVLKKLLSRFNKAERLVLESLTVQIISLNWRGLNVKKLKGYEDVFRVRKGKTRIIFVRNGSMITFLSIEHRSETTYRF